MVLPYLIQAGMRSLTVFFPTLWAESQKRYLYIAPNNVLCRPGFEEDVEEAKNLFMFAFTLKNIFKLFKTIS